MLLEAEVPSSWPPGEYDRFAIAYFRDRLIDGGEAVVPWYVWYAIRPAEPGTPATLVACGGYFGPPSADGTVEIGYSVVPEWRRHGYATELVQALIARAFAAPEVRRILAEADVENVASIGVLTRCGFRRVGTGTRASLSIDFSSIAPYGRRQIRPSRGRPGPLAIVCVAAARIIGHAADAKSPASRPDQPSQFDMRFWITGIDWRNRAIRTARRPENRSGSTRSLEVRSVNSPKTRYTRSGI